MKRAVKLLAAATLAWFAWGVVVNGVIDQRVQAELEYRGCE